MKKVKMLFALMLTVVLSIMSIHAQVATKVAPKKEQTKYCCKECGYISPVKGQCPHSTEAIMKDGTLYCALCYDKPGKCPKCGTKLSKVEIKEKPNNAKQITFYCPMHRDVTSDKPGSCPKCGMGLMEKE